MIIALAVGLAVSLVQALTQIQEQTLIFVPKILAVFATMLLMLPFMGDALAGYMIRRAHRRRGVSSLAFDCWPNPSPQGRGRGGVSPRQRLPAAALEAPTVPLAPYPTRLSLRPVRPPVRGGISQYDQSMTLLIPELAMAFMLTFARVGTLVMLLPGIGEQMIPPRMRLAFALLLTLVLFPLTRTLLPASPAPRSLLLCSPASLRSDSCSGSRPGW